MISADKNQYKIYSRAQSGATLSGRKRDTSRGLVPNQRDYGWIIALELKLNVFLLRVLPAFIIFFISQDWNQGRCGFS